MATDCSLEIATLRKIFPKETVAAYQEAIEELGVAPLSQGDRLAQLTLLNDQTKVRQLNRLKAAYQDVVKQVTLVKGLDNPEYRTFKGMLKKEWAKPDPEEALKNTLVRTTRSVKGRNVNAENYKTYYEGRLYRVLDQNMRDTGLEDAVLKKFKHGQDAEIEGKVADYLFDQADVNSKIKPKLTGKHDPATIKIGDAFFAVLKEQRGVMKEAGMDTGFLHDKFVRTIHNIEKIIQPQHQAEWLEDVFDLMDKKRSFGTEEPDAIMTILDGTMEEMKRGTSVNGITVKGGKRVFHFKNAESFMKYREKWGSGKGLYQSMADDNRSLSGNAAVTKMYGNNPEDTLKKAFTHIEKNLGKPLSDNFKTNMRMGIRAVQGKLNTKASAMSGYNKAYRRIGGYVRSTTLGAAPLSVLFDPFSMAVKSSMHNADNYLQNYMRAIQKQMQYIGKIKTKGEIEDMIDNVGVALRSDERYQEARFITVEDSMVNYGGKVDEFFSRKAPDFVSRATGMDHVSEASKLASMDMAIHDVNRMLTRSATDVKLSADEALTLRNMNLEPQDVKDIYKIMKGVGDDGEFGEWKFTAEHVGDTLGIKGKELTKRLEFLRDSVSLHLSDHFLHASPSSSVSGKWGTWQLRPTDSPRELATKLFMMFKEPIHSVSLTAMERMTANSSGAMWDKSGAGWMFSMMLAAGLFSSPIYFPAVTDPPIPII